MLVPMLIPLAASAAFAGTVASLHRRLPPVLAARAITMVLALVAAAALPTVWITALGFVAHLPLIHHWLGRCAAALGSHHEVAPALGLLATVFTLAGLIRTGQTLRRYRALYRSHGSLEIADDDGVFAVTLPGRGGHIVLSRGLQQRLSPEETAVVVAHERAHARHRHDRYLLTGQLAVALMFPLRPLVRQLGFSLERWADESAVSACGDRRFVARTLGRVAVCSAEVQPSMAFAGLSVAARMRALMAPPVAPPHVAARVGLWVAIASAAAFAAVQVQHLGIMLVSLCSS